MGSSSTSLIEMSMCDAAFHDIPCHHAIQVLQGDNQETIDMVVSCCIVVLLSTSKTKVHVCISNSK